MHTANRIALAVCACAWLLPAADSLAQSAPPVLTGAADPGASVPATTYQPAIGNNATVAAYNSMSLTMKMKGMHAPPAAAPADPHAGHAAPAAPVEHAEHAGHAMHSGPAHHADAAARPAASPAESP